MATYMFTRVEAFVRDRDGDYRSIGYVPAWPNDTGDFMWVPDEIRDRVGAMVKETLAARGPLGLPKKS